VATTFFDNFTVRYIENDEYILMILPQLEYVDLEEFLTENGIPMDSQNGVASSVNGNPSPPDLGNSNSCLPHASTPTDTTMLAGPSRMPGHNMLGSPSMKNPMNHHHLRSRSPSPVGSQSSCMSNDMSADLSPDSSQQGGGTHFCF
jgi:hypothetical protein